MILYILPLCLALGTIDAKKDFYSFTAIDITGDEIDLGRYRGKVSLVVNVASECGFTDNHYKQLVQLQNQLGKTGAFNVLAFPCNQFGNQEPKDNIDILDFVDTTYGVNFPFFSKINVIDNNIPRYWQYLAGQAEVGAPTWNFFKYLVNHEGKVVNAWGPWTDVEGIAKEVRKALTLALVERDSKNRQTVSASARPADEL